MKLGLLRRERNERSSQVLPRVGRVVAPAPVADGPGRVRVDRAHREQVLRRLARDAPAAPRCRRRPSCGSRSRADRPPNRSSRPRTRCRRSTGRCGRSASCQLLPAVGACGRSRRSSPRPRGCRRRSRSLRRGRREGRSRPPRTSPRTTSSMQRCRRTRSSRRNPGRAIARGRPNLLNAPPRRARGAGAAHPERRNSRSAQCATRRGSNAEEVHDAPTGGRFYDVARLGVKLRWRCEHGCADDAQRHA